MVKTTSVEHVSGELSSRADSARLPAKSLVVATAQKPGSAAVSGLGSVEARRDARFGISGGDTGKSVALLERPVQHKGAFVPPGGRGPVFTSSEPAAVALRSSSHAEPYSGVPTGAVSHPLREEASDSFQRARGMEDAVRDAIGQEAELLETGIGFEAARDELQVRRIISEALSESMRGAFSHAVRFASTD